MQTLVMWERLSIWEWDDSERTVRFRRMVRRGEEFPFGYRGVHVRRRHYQISARFTLRRFARARNDQCEHGKYGQNTTSPRKHCMRFAATFRVPSTGVPP